MQHPNKMITALPAVTLAEQAGHLATAQALRGLIKSALDRPSTAKPLIPRKPSQMRLGGDAAAVPRHAPGPDAVSLAQFD